MHWKGPQDANGVLNAFTVKAWDGALASDTAVQVKVDVAAVNDAPTAQAMSMTLNETQIVDLLKPGVVDASSPAQSIYLWNKVADVDNALSDLSFFLKDAGGNVIVPNTEGVASGVSTSGAPVDIVTDTDGTLHLYYSATADKFDTTTSNLTDTFTYYVKDSLGAWSSAVITTTVKEAGKNEVTLGNSADNVTYGSANDLVYANNGDDMLHGGLGADILYGGNGNDTLYGDEGNDKLLGGNGDDLLVGGVGKDILWGDRGNDTLTGDGGGATIRSADIFLFYKSSGTDKITDFNQGAGYAYDKTEGDKIQFSVDSGITASNLLSKVTVSTAADGWALLNAGSVGQIELVGVTKATLLTSSGQLDSTLFQFGDFA